MMTTVEARHHQSEDAWSKAYTQPLASSMGCVCCLVKVGSGEKPSVSKLDSNDVFLYDTGFRVWL